MLNKKILALILPFSILCSQWAVSETPSEKKLYLVCQDIEGKAPLLNVLREGNVPYLQYEISGASYLTQLRALSDNELTGNEGSWLVFFEYLATEGNFLLSVYETSDFSLVAAVKMDCQPR